jgi:hypothetical protein
MRARQRVQLGARLAPAQSKWGVRATAILPSLAAACLAFWSLGFGLPFLFRPDEDVMVGRSVHIVLEHSLDPLFVYYPPLAFYVFAASQALARFLTGMPLGPATAVDPTGAVVAARAASALAFIAAVAAVQRAAAMVYGLAPGFLAGICVAVAPLAVREAHFATPDALSMALVAATILASTRLLGLRSAMVAGLLAGLAAATKYTPGLVVLVPLLVCLHLPDRHRMAPLLLATAAATFVATTLLADSPAQVLAGLEFLLTRAAEAHAGPIGLTYHTTLSLPFGLGPGSLLLVVLGVATAAVRRTHFDLGLIAFLVAYSSTVAFSHEVFARYVLPMFPALAVLAGSSITAAWARRLRTSMVAAVSALLLLPSLASSIESDLLLSRTDTRAQAAAWLLSNAPAGSELMISSYWGQPFYDIGELGPSRLNPLYISGNSLADSFQMGRYSAAFVINRPGVPCYTIQESTAPFQVGRVRPSGGIDFFPYSHQLPGGAVYDQGDSFYLPLWGFRGLDRPGPAITVINGCAPSKQVLERTPRGKHKIV